MDGPVSATGTSAIRSRKRRKSWIPKKIVKQDSFMNFDNNNEDGSEIDDLAEPEYEVNYENTVSCDMSPDDYRNTSQCEAEHCSTESAPIAPVVSIMSPRFMSKMKNNITTKNITATSSEPICDTVSKDKNHIAFKNNDKSDSDDKIQKELMNIGGRTLKCQLCRYATIDAAELGKHMSRHSLERKYKCTQCSFETVYQGSFKRHCKQHSGIRPFECELCDFSSIQLCNLKQHMVTHSNERKFACPICEYKGNRITQLRRHMRQHTGERPFACDRCDYVCAHSSSLKQHIASKHDKNYQFKCEDCEFSAIDIGSLNKHRRKHAKVKPYQCTDCNYTTAHPAAYRRHRLKHDDKPLLTCKLCNYGSMYTSQIKQHLRKSHSQLSSDFIENLNKFSKFFKGHNSTKISSHISQSCLTDNSEATPVRSSESPDEIKYDELCDDATLV